MGVESGGLRDEAALALGDHDTDRYKSQRLFMPSLEASGVTQTPWEE